MKHCLDIQAPILPGESLGGLVLKTHIRDIYDILKKIAYSKDGIYTFDDPFYVKYEVKDTISAVFHVLNGKLIKIGALEKYQGTLLGGIKVGMSLDTAMKIEPKLYYDEVEEMFFIKDIYGISLETNGIELSSEESHQEKIIAITVYALELNNFNEVHEKGHW